MSQSSVSVHIVTYNSGRTIRQCLDAVLRQADRAMIRVYDNASADNTVSVLRSYGIRFMQGHNNIGYAAAHNRLLKQNSSTFVLTLNPDVFLKRGFIKEIQSSMLAHGQNTGSASGALLRVQSSGGKPVCIDACGLFLKKNRGQGLRRYEQPISSLPDHAEEIFGPDGAAAFYSRKALASIAVDGEVFDEDFFSYKEDVDVCWRLQNRGWKSIFVPKARAHHIRTFRPGYRSGIPHTIKMMSVRNRYLLMMKNDSLQSIALHAIPILWYEVRSFGYMLLRERSSLAAYADAFGLRRAIMKKRGIMAANGSKFGIEPGYIGAAQ